MTDGGKQRDERAPEAIAPLSYRNIRGQVYYLHGGTTKSGRPRYFVAKSIGPGALASLPEGFELVESINGVVSVRRTTADDPQVPAADLAQVRAALDAHPRLGRYRAEVVRGEIVVFEPVGNWTPVMRLVPAEAGYALYRMTFRGEGGWSRWPVAHGPLAQLASTVLPTLGTDAFFELF